MSRYTIFDLQGDARRKLTTSDPSASLDFYGAILEAKRNMTKRIAPPEMVRKNYLEDAIFEHVDEIAVPDDLNYNDIIEIKKLKSYRNKNVDTLDHEIQLVYRKRFNQKRYGGHNVMTVGYTNGLKTASIQNPTGLHSRNQMIHNCDSLDNNGIWNVGGNLVNLTEDKLNYIEGRGSFKFDFNNSGSTGWIENSTMKTVDLYDFLQVGAIFNSLSISIPKNIISVRLRLYSSDNDYYEYSVNAPHDSTVFKTGWNVLKFLFDNQYVVGNPNPRELIKIRYDFTTNGESTPGMRLDSIIARTGEVYEMTYQSSFCIIDATTGAWKLRPTQGADMLPFEDDTYQVFMLETALVLQKELYANNAAAKADVENVANELQVAYDEYDNNHPSEVIEPNQVTYNFGDEYSGYQDDIMDNHYQNDWNRNDN